MKNKQNSFEISRNNSTKNDITTKLKSRKAPPPQKSKSIAHNLKMCQRKINCREVKTEREFTGCSSKSTIGPRIEARVRIECLQRSEMKSNKKMIIEGEIKLNLLFQTEEKWRKKHAQKKQKINNNDEFFLGEVARSKTQRMTSQLNKKISPRNSNKKDNRRHKLQGSKTERKFTSCSSKSAIGSEIEERASRWRIRKVVKFNQTKN